jgi:ABC-2 type transport system ATP-binding protein
VTAVAVENLWKKFRVYHDRVYSLKERLIFWNRQRREDFWALKNLTLTVPQGATLALIGRNGSGKSTLLKIISRIIYPTRGEVRVRGRLSTLLALGSGFHPDFTGRENIFLNASILGLTRKEIKSRLNEIIAFAELDHFIDNPVRNYSSGMYMRLGFAVAAHVNPDILLVDEVLAVGDLAFQEKCLNKIREFQKEGKTIIVVTHNMEQVKSFCGLAVWLDQGEARLQGPAQGVADAYTEALSTTGGPKAHG